jgi:hypothetical protein
MVTLVEMPEVQSKDRCKSQGAGNSQGRDAPSRGDGLMERILENMGSTPWEEVSKRIASSPDIRRGKVLSIRRQITESTYQVEDRLDGVIDRVLEAITCPSEGPYLERDGRSGPAKLVAC